MRDGRMTSAFLGALTNCARAYSVSRLTTAPVERKTMKRRLWLFVPALVFLVALRPGAAQRVDLHVDLKERVNAVYHLACLAGSITCTKDVFERFWKERLAWTDADQAALDLWRQTMMAVTNEAKPRPPAPLLPNTPRFHPTQVARTAVIVAAIESESVRGLRRRSHDVLNAETAARVKSAVDHFERRLRPWLRTTARLAVERRMAQVRQVARRSRFAETTAQMAAFLEAELPDSNAYVHAIVGPEPQSRDFTATQLGNHFVVEIVDAATADGIVSVATHELTHYIYDRAPAHKHLALIEEFVNSAAPSSAGLYTYLNEAVAIAAQGLHADKGDGPDDDDSYRHPYVAPLGAVTIDLVTKAVADKATLFDGFASSYIAAGTAALKEKLLQPQFALAQVGLLLPNESDAIRTAYFETMFPQASAQLRDEHELNAFPDLNVVRFVRYDELGALGDRIPGLAALRGHRGFAYAVPRGQRARTYLLAGRDAEAIIDVITKLAGMKVLPSEGLLFSLD
jgi:hypothetical protein